MGETEVYACCKFALCIDKNIVVAVEYKPSYRISYKILECVVFCSYFVLLIENLQIEKLKNEG